MRQLPKNCNVGDQVLLKLSAAVEITANEDANGDRLLTARVVSLQHSANDTVVMWSLCDDGTLEVAVEVGRAQRLLMIGLSSRQRDKLKDRLAGLSSDEARALLMELGLVAQDRDVRTQSRPSPTTTDFSELPEA